MRIYTDTFIAPKLAIMYNDKFIVLKTISKSRI